jgi:hypothetical protein
VSQAISRQISRAGRRRCPASRTICYGVAQSQAIRRTAQRKDRRPLHDPSGSLFGSMHCKSGVRSVSMHRNIGPRKDHSPRPDLFGSSFGNKGCKLIEESRQLREPRSRPQESRRISSEKSVRS